MATNCTPRVQARGLGDQNERESQKGRHELVALSFLSSLRDVRPVVAGGRP